MVRERDEQDLQVEVAFTAVHFGDDTIRLEIESITKANGTDNKTRYDIGKIDALSRDFTVNSLAYNIEEMTVVDRLDG